MASTIEADNNGNYFLWGSNIRLRNFDINDFPFIRELIAEVWTGVEMQDFKVDKASISVYKNNIGIAAISSAEFKGAYSRAKISRCSLCKGVTDSFLIYRLMDGSYVRSEIISKESNHEFDCPYWLVHNIMEM